MIDLGANEIEVAVLDALDRVLAGATSPGWIIEAGECRLDASLWKSLTELIVFDAGMAQDGATFLTSALVADRLGAALTGLSSIDHVVVLRLLERLGGEAAELRTRLVGEGALVGLLMAPSQAGAASEPVCPTGAVADHVIRIGPDGRVGHRANAPAAATFVPNLGDLPLAAIDAAGDWTRLTGDLAVLADLLAERKVLVAAALGGMARRAVELAADYARERTLFGAPIGGFQSLAHGMASGRVQADGVELLAREAAWARDADLARFQHLAAMAYAFAATAAPEAIRFAMHVFGGYGVTREYPVQTYFRTAKALVLATGDPRLDLRGLGEALVAEAARGADGMRVGV